MHWWVLCVQIITVTVGLAAIINTTKLGTHKSILTFVHINVNQFTEHLHTQEQVHGIGHNEWLGAVAVPLYPDHCLFPHIHLQVFEAVVPLTQLEYLPAAYIKENKWHTLCHMADALWWKFALWYIWENTVPINVKNAILVEVYITSAWFPFVAHAYKTVSRLR